MRALIVDDSRAVRMMMRRALSECGFDDFAEAGDGQEALDALESGSLPDVAFVDWNMPVMNGIEFLKALRAEPEGKGPNVIMCSVENEPARIIEALEAGADEYIMKPFDGDILEAKFAEAGLVA